MGYAGWEVWVRCLGMGLGCRGSRVMGEMVAASFWGVLCILYVWVTN